LAKIAPRQAGGEQDRIGNAMKHSLIIGIGLSQ
jgi:hypothetical protein